ncbi:helix-turn-helix domain-containing protein [Viridibacillus arvi]|uniref:helix-turn-helix domain-containing protein n=1 Tax=Viridibacillus arvi TaxID=263475 RepID=UPI0034CDFA76
MKGESKRKYHKAMTASQLRKFGDFLLRQRQSIGYTAVQMAEIIGTHYTSYRRWERGMCMPQLDPDEIKEDVKRVVAYVKKNKKMGKAV